jgi:hypothetical protein
VIEALGSTSLAKVGNNFYLDSISSGTGPELKSAGMAVDATQTNGWAPIGAEQTATGYEVAWKLTGSDQYTVWATDSSGNYTSSLLGVVSGSSTGLESLETSFHQDLNGDGTVGIPSASGSATLQSAGAGSLKVGFTAIPAGDLVVGANQDSFVFAPNLGEVTIANFDPAKDTIQINPSIFADTTALLAATHDDGHGSVVITDAAHDMMTIQHLTVAELLAHQNDFQFV